MAMGSGVSDVGEVTSDVSMRDRSVTVHQGEQRRTPPPVSFTVGTFRSLSVGLLPPPIDRLLLWHRVFGWHFNTCTGK